jgi:hypothetical protein
MPVDVRSVPRALAKSGGELERNFKINVELRRYESPEAQASGSSLALR